MRKKDLTKTCSSVTGIIDKAIEYYNYFHITKPHECYRNGKLAFRRLFSLVTMLFFCRQEKQKREMGRVVEQECTRMTYLLSVCPFPHSGGVRGSELLS